MRSARTHHPGAIVHVISKFVYDEYLLDLPGAREQALQRMGIAVARTDWILLAYALMSNHLHWALQVGFDAAERIFKSLNVGLASWINHQRGIVGPVFRARPLIIQVPRAHFGRLATYIHNNPMRANVVTRPEASAWTSHRAYMGLEAPPEHLNVDLALDLAGFDSSPSGRLGFGKLVHAHVNDERDAVLSGDGMPEIRAEHRREEAAPVEILDGRVDNDGQLFSLPERDALLPERKLADLTLPEVLLTVEHALDLEPGDLRSCRRTRTVTEGRALALVVWSRFCGQSQRTMARALGLSDPAASQLVARRQEGVWDRACAIAGAGRGRF